MKKTYTIVHVDTDQGVRAWFPDFPDLIIPGDRLADMQVIRRAYSKDSTN